MPVISPKKPYRVGRSRTGLGLFATKRIKKGTKIIRYFGPLLDSKKKKDDAIENKYLFELNNRWTIDGSVRKNVARYINHACKPNAESDVRPRKRKVFIRAVKNIEPGDEINYDYGTDYFKAYLKPIGCKCDACEKKRKKKRAEARAERLLLKAKELKKELKKAERKSLRKAEKAAAKRKEAKEKLKPEPKSLQPRSLQPKSLQPKSARKSVSAEANGKHVNGRLAQTRPASGRRVSRAGLNGRGRAGVNAKNPAPVTSGGSPAMIAANEVAPDMAAVNLQTPANPAEQHMTA
jgi:uncharacterized protein